MQEIIKLANISRTYKVPVKDESSGNLIKHLFVKHFETKTAVKSCDLSIKKGEFVGLIGPNGAGKTTLIKMMSGIIAPSSGTIAIMGFTPIEQKNEFKRRFSVIMGQKSQLWWDISANESFKLFKEIYNINNQEFQTRLDDLCLILNVEHLLHTPIRYLSLGERMKMELIACLLHNPEIIYLDEPTIGLDVQSRKNIRDFLKLLNQKQKTTILLTSHYIEDIKFLCNRIIAINRGDIIFDGPFEEISSRFVDHKKITVTYDETHECPTYGNLGNCTEIIENRRIYLVPRDHLKEFCLKCCNSESFVDIAVEEIPIDEVFEKIFSRN